MGADVSLFKHSHFGKVTHRIVRAFFHGELWKTEQANGVSGRGLECKDAMIAWQSLIAFSQPTLNLALPVVEQKSPTQLLVCSLSHNFY